MDTNEFNECLQQLVVFDHVYNCPLFTWTNRQGKGFIAKKLDMELINGNWLFSFPLSREEFFSLGSSDHCLVKIQLSQISFSHLSLLKCSIFGQSIMIFYKWFVVFGNFQL